MLLLTLSRSIGRQSISKIGQYARFTHSQPKRITVPDPIEWLPLPRPLVYRKAIMLLSLPIPPSSWPSHLEMASPLLATASANLKSKGIAVNAIYDGIGNETKFANEEQYKARIFWPDGHSKSYDSLNMESISSENLLNDLEYIPKDVNIMDGNQGVTKEILVCTHGSRDCRCSDRGGPLVDALREEAERRGLGNQVKITEIAHVGGHKYAANAILLPSLDMLSNLTLEHAPSIISHILSPKANSQMWAHWRGRFGLTETQQVELWSEINPENNLRKIQKEVEAKEEKVKLRFKTFESEEKIVQAKLGNNLLEVGKENDLPSLEGVCGGNLECATCHLYLPPKPTPSPTGEASDEEFDMLGYALGYKDGESRLGCQVKVTKELSEWCKSGGVIGLPRF